MTTYKLLDDEAECVDTIAYLIGGDCHGNQTGATG